MERRTLPKALSAKLTLTAGAAAQVCLKGTLFTPLSRDNTSTQSLNVQLRKVLDLHVNLVHGFNIAGVPSRFSDVDVVVIRRAPMLPFWLVLLASECHA